MPTIKEDLLTLSEFLDWPSAVPPTTEDVEQVRLAFLRVSDALDRSIPGIRRAPHTEFVVNHDSVGGNGGARGSVSISSIR